MTFYSFEERDKAYAVMDKTETLVNLLEQIGKGKAAPDADLQMAIAGMTGTSDLNQQYKAMKTLHSTITKNHSNRIFAAAPEDFSAFVEAITPSEPCRSQVHRFMTHRLMDMAEIDNSKMAVSMPPGHAKDLCVETPVLMGDGSSKRLGDVEVGDMVITHTGHAREVLEVHDQGVRDTLILETAMGRSIRTHPEHPFLTPAGWIPAGELAAGDVLAQQREYSIANTSGRTREEFIIAGYMMAYGLVRNRAYSRLYKIDTTFRADDHIILEDVLSLTKQLGYRGKTKIGISYNEEVRTIHFEETFRYWLEQQGLYGVHRHEMRIPAWVYKGSTLEIGAFVGAIFSMDAKAVPTRSRHTGAQRQIMFKLRNAGLAKDFRRLLMRLGVRCQVSSRLERCYNYEPTTFWTVTIPWDEDIFLLKKSMRVVGVNRRLWDGHVNVRRFFDTRFGEDIIMRSVPSTPTLTRCLNVDTDHSFLADGIIVHNSTYCSRLFPAWWLGRNEGKKWLQAGHTKNFAMKEFGKKTRDNILNTAAYARVFGVFTTNNAMEEITLSNGASYVVKGVGEGVSGYRSNFNNIDDPYPTEKAAQSEVTRNAVWEWFTNDFRTRRLPGASELIIVTRWHSDDIVGRMEDLIAEGEMPADWDFVNLPAFSLGEDLDQLRRKQGEVLWPEFFTEKFLLDMKAPMNPSRWESLYQGSPTLTDGLVLQRKWIRYWEKMPSLKFASGDPVNPKVPEKIPAFILQDRGPYESLTGRANPPPENSVSRMRIVISVDSAEKDTVRADFTAIQVWLYGTDRKHYLLDALKQKLEFPELIVQVELAATKWGADIILCETKGAGNQYVQARGQTGLAPCPVIGYNPGRDDKTIRFEGTMALFQAGDVLFPARAPWLEGYIDELLRFPHGKNDDQVDATSQYLNWHRDGGAVRRGTKKLAGTG